ncbi:unnamed protein product [Closterium sp. Naga37s-1]|nr:unnamed protein product [Closterium sp. Naga37s-1]
MATVQSSGLSSLLRGSLRPEPRIAAKSSAGPTPSCRKRLAVCNIRARADGRSRSGRFAASSAAAASSTSLIPAAAALASDSPTPDTVATVADATAAVAEGEGLDIGFSSNDLDLGLDAPSSATTDAAADAAADVAADAADAVSAAANSIAVPDEVLDLPTTTALPDLPKFSYPTRDVAPSFEKPGFSMPEFKKPEFTMPEFKKPDFEFSLPEFKKPEFSIPDFQNREFSLPEFKKPEFSLPEFKKPDFALPDFKKPEFSLPENLSDLKAPSFSLPEFAKPEFNLPDSSELPLPKTDFKLPDLPTPEFNLPEIPLPSFPIPSLPSPSNLPVPKLTVPRAISEPVENAVAAATASVADSAAAAAAVAQREYLAAYSALRETVPADALPLVEKVEANLASLWDAASGLTKEVAVQVAVLSAAAVRAAFGAAGFDADDTVVAATLIATGTLLLGVAYWRAAYGGYSGNLSAEEALEVLKESKAVLVDIRPEFLRDENGIPDLRRGARFKDCSVKFEKLGGPLRGQVRRPDVVDLQLMAAKIKGVRGVQKDTQVIIMDESGGNLAKEIARGLSRVGFKRSFVMDGGFDSWVASGLRVKPNEPERAADVLKKEYEAFVEDVQPTPLGVATVVLGTGVGIFALIEWERSLQLLGVLAVVQLIYLRVKTYETEEDLQRDVRALLTPFSLAASAAGWALGTSSSASAAPKAAKQLTDGEGEGGSESKAPDASINGSARQRSAKRGPCNVCGTEDDEDEEEERLYDAVSLSSSISSSGDDVSSEGGFSRVSSTGSLSGLDDRVRVKVHPGRVDIFNGAEHLRLRADGLMELRRVKDGVPVLITAGRVSLPDTCRDYIESCEITVLDESIGAVQLKWINGSALRVVAANPAGVEKGDLSALPFDRDHGNPASDPSWAKKLACGFVCEFSVAQHAEEEARGMAEVELDMRTAGYWFGGGHYMRQHWPLNRGQFEMGPFFPFDNGPNGTNTLLAPQWMTSRGLLVLANPDTPFLHVGLNAPHVGPHDGWIQRSWGTGVQNLARESLPAAENGTGDGMLRLQARASYRTVEMLHPLRDWMPAMWKEEQDKDQRLSLQFALCATANVKQAAEAALETLPRPANPPPREMVDAPIWTTWARYHANVTQANVEQFAHEIVGRGLSRSVMEIDDKWQTKYGDFDFDPVKFPNPKAMVEMLHALGFKVTLWIMPFVEEASAAYQEGAPKGYFISSSAPATKGLKPGFFKWWQPVPAAALDVTNPEAVAWFVGRLKRLQADYLIDGFKFDAGEPCFLPPHFVTHKPIVTPVEYTRLYVQEVASQFSYAEVRTGHKTSSVPLLTRMGDRFSTWSTGNGLRSVIPTLLTSGILGYPFCLPDMVGGNAYFGNKPDVELLVRWAQANALMPAMQFSIAPWDLSKEADRLCKAMLETFPIDDQFAIGDDIVVAPVVVKGQKKRDVYLPKGTWCELLNPSNTFEGPTWLEDVEAPLHIIPIYCRVVPTDIASPNQEGGQEVADHASAMVPVPVRIEDAALVIADSEALAEGSATQTVKC